MLLDNALHQKPVQPGLSAKGHGEAEEDSGRGEAGLAQCGAEGLGRVDLLEQALARANMVLAWKRVKANGGSAGADGLKIAETIEKLGEDWPRIKEELCEGKYRPVPVRRVQIPKSGGDRRELSIPSVTDRLIQQALLQILQPMIDPTFSESSYGFRPGRNAHGAVLQAQRYVQDGYDVVVDVDLEKFFDRVNHDILMDRLSRRISDKRVLRLIRCYLEAGIMDGGVVIERYEGMPQGGPLSPLLANVLLDEVDRELEKRGHKFVRYADDCNVYVRSQKAGERVLRGLRKLYAKLHLKVNEDKTSVGSAYRRKFLGYSLWKAPGKEVKRKVSKQTTKAFKDRVRKMTGRSRGRSMEQVIEELRRCLLGWKAYYGLAQTPGKFRELDEWLRHRLRAMQLKHWKRGRTMYAELRKLGASHEQAARVSANARRWWRNSKMELNRVMPIAWFDKQGLPRLS